MPANNATAALHALCPVSRADVEALPDQEREGLAVMCRAVLRMCEAVRRPSTEGVLAALKNGQRAE